MPMLWYALTMAATLAMTSEPAPVPSGMDLLYDDHVPILPSGEPIVTVGLAIGLDDVTLRSRAVMHVDFYEGGLFKQAIVQPGQGVHVGIRRAQPAQRNHYVDVQGVVPPTSAALHAAIDVWHARGFADATGLEDGMILGIAGRVLDNRQVRVVLPTAGEAQARSLADQVNRQFGTRALVKERLAERPWGELAVHAGATPLGLAVSYVRFSSTNNEPLQVDDIEFGQGYAWQGRENRTYRGEIYAVVDPNAHLAVVNAVGAEALLQGVVPAEIFSTAAPEALKAQAVAARNTLLAKLGHRHHEEPYHLCAEQHCQVYAGTAREDPRTTTAVTQTRGQALFLHNHLVDAVYSASCGGYTEDNDAVWGDVADPALRGRPDFDISNRAFTPFMRGITAANAAAFFNTPTPAYCAQAPQSKPEKYRWQRSFNSRELTDTLAKNSANIGRLKNITVRERGHGGRITHLVLEGDQRTLTLQRELPIRQFFGNLNSAAFVVDAHHDAQGYVDTVTLVGGGWGHGVGMCQLGAMGRAQAGQTYAQILTYYYNGATLQPLYDSPLPGL